VARAAALALLAVGLGAFAFHWVRTSLNYVHETDARIVADLVAVSSRVAGVVDERPAEEGRAIERGEVLVRIDARDARLRLAELEAELKGVDGERDRLSTELAMVEGRTSSRYANERSNLDALRALLDSVQAEFRFAKDEHDRAQALSSRGVVSSKDLDRARTAFLKAQQERLRAEAAISGGKARLAEADAARQEIEVMHRQLASLVHRRAEVQARVERQRLDVQDREVRSPLAGVVARTFIDVGEYVSPGQRIALVYDPKAIWVETNIRETELDRLRVGQPVEIAVDAYPNRKLEGRVERIGLAATSEFALLPSPNPSGNFTKITQRVPVRITLPDHADLLRPGMMVVVYIDVSDR
jgi:membrane fusion protein (multidrug efflux system)